MLELPTRSWKRRREDTRPVDKERKRSCSISVRTLIVIVALAGTLTACSQLFDLPGKLAGAEVSSSLVHRHVPCRMSVWTAAPRPTRQSQKVPALISSFRLVCVGTSVIAEIRCLYTGFYYISRLALSINGMLCTPSCLATREAIIARVGASGAALSDLGVHSIAQRPPMSHATPV
ncbi:uncharacterized protein B0H18DRAFT_1002241 [Fomitopsis serialis]|uniref:uncharacterized protein n=1 Tax=Fomitopsis serialis TaxID=139415 RepID=UPI0020077C6C|nr:uncharacterized protein B0H18DRAFT_1002241 [Neoantrodia serialis]KAH9927795.1 hypothetical protein B0H18DRAFT_1002241 [Neoantrodia serialis]